MNQFDTEYIEMCKMSEYIQSLHKKSDHTPGLTFVHVDGPDAGDLYVSATDENWIWLPTIDDLVCLIQYNNEKIKNSSKSFFNYIATGRVSKINDRFFGKEKITYTLEQDFNSVEKHLLTFFMFDKYTKVWVDKRWIHIKLHDIKFQNN